MSSAAAGPRTFRWLLDVRSDWQDDFSSQAAPWLSVLPPSTHKSILAYYFAKDRAMALGSALLKYHAIQLATDLPYTSITISQDPATKKPIYQPPSPTSASISFNVSHQAGLVALVGSIGAPDREVGIDIVCVNERNDLERIATSEEKDGHGFADWVDIHAEVFAPAEVEDMKTWLPALPSSSSPVENAHWQLEQRLRRFYAFWALKEAYVKLRGEALLAPWLRDLEFRNVRVPEVAHDGERLASASTRSERQVVRDVEAWFRGKRVSDVRLELRAIESRFMIATAVQTSGFASDSASPESSSVGGTDGSEDDLFPDFSVLNLQVFGPLSS